MIGGKLITPGESLDNIRLGEHTNNIIESLENHYFVERVNEVIFLNGNEILTGVEEEDLIWWQGYLGRWGTGASRKT
ncbi:hypothetical protein RA241_003824 [Cronobacter sakazakii]|uniref:hypothetical protein n=1 Tax=Cronobacter sakazakii TaxID=28141 RepID=UPI000AE674C5|nr:hypothetical protein [Cronobacter sakazakii]EIV2972251.1 hypothetical protein [Cronobacter sakazakii]EIX1505997.1 hypothetical protein [Cronobacter sakazakii]EIX1527061.1 hypothetical protein [Cronobacter sakazakii]EIX1624218.1 hypothetical protein [Cronobacter sakazakii]EIX1666000.1 hypothetical protein [Cronobacter sakazakii]